MGWSSGWNSYKELKDYLLKCGNSNYVILENKSTQYGKNLWLSYKEVGTGKTLIQLYLIKKHDDWGYKGISESMGPSEIDCPLELINKTTGDGSNYSNEWRQRVRDYHAHSKSVRELQIGEVVKVYGEYYKIDRKIKRTFIGVHLKSGGHFKLKIKQIERLETNAEKFILTGENV